MAISDEGEAVRFACGSHGEGMKLTASRTARATEKKARTEVVAGLILQVVGTAGFDPRPPEPHA